MQEREEKKSDRLISIVWGLRWNINNNNLNMKMFLEMLLKETVVKELPTLDHNTHPETLKSSGLSMNQISMVLNWAFAHLL